MQFSSLPTALKARQLHRTLEKTVWASGQEFRLRAVSPQNPHRFHGHWRVPLLSTALSPIMVDVGRTVPCSRSAELVALPNADVAPVYEVGVLSETKQLENLLGEIPSLRRARSHVNPVRRESRERVGDAWKQRVFGVSHVSAPSRYSRPAPAPCRGRRQGQSARRPSPRVAPVPGDLTRGETAVAERPIPPAGSLSVPSRSKMSAAIRIS